jgi:hypothetical protein
MLHHQSKARRVFLLAALLAMAAASIAQQPRSRQLKQPRRQLPLDPQKT